MQRARELQELASSRTKKSWDEVLAAGSGHGVADDLEENEQQRRARELHELTGSMSKKSWDEAVGEDERRMASKTPGPCSPDPSRINVMLLKYFVFQVN
jgi:hypothetical protein